MLCVIFVEVININTENMKVETFIYASYLFEKIESMEQELREISERSGSGCSASVALGAEIKLLKTEFASL